MDVIISFVEEQFQPVGVTAAGFIVCAILGGKLYRVREEIFMAKVLLLNGSPKANGCTATALNEMISVFKEEGIETEIIHVGNKDIRGCVSCGYPAVNEAGAEKLFLTGALIMSVI